MEQGSETEPGIEADTPIVVMVRSPLCVFATVRIRIQVSLYCLNACSLGLSRAEPRTLSGDSGWEFASVLGSANPQMSFEWDLVTRRSDSNHRFPAIRESSQQTFDPPPRRQRKLVCA